MSNYTFSSTKVFGFSRLLLPGWAALSMAVAPSVIAADGPFCDLVFETCPGKFNNTVITVPKSVVSLSTRMPYCQDGVQVTTQVGIPPSVMFIIDNSGSMDDGSSKGNDPTEERFTQTVKMIDDIFATSPSAHIGITSFSRRLQFDNRDPYLLASAFPGDTSQHDAYVPLTALDTTFANGVKGIDTLKAMLKFEATGKFQGSLVYDGRKYPESRTGANTQISKYEMRQGTDITLGFESAKLAMKKSPSPKESQFFVFLSDGTATSVDPTRRATLDDYQKGIETPTTFTVFFNKGSGSTERNIDVMTAAIKGNQYSSSNDKSAKWTIQDPAAELQNILKSQVLGNIVTTVPSQAKSATLTQTGKTPLVATGLDGQNFAFEKRLGLQADKTIFTYAVNYTYTDSKGVQQTKLDIDTLTIQRTGVEPPAGISKSCREAPDISLVSAGKSLTTVTADHNALEVRVVLGGAQTCTTCSAQISDIKGQDKEQIALAQAGSYLTGTFSREVNTTAIPSDKKLQHYALGDSIVVDLINPEIPLEVSRKAFKYDDISSELKADFPAWVVTPPTADQIPTNIHFVLANAPTLIVTPNNSTNCCVAQPAEFGAVDTNMASNPNRVGSYFSIDLKASREFAAEISIFDHLGQFVNKTAFSISKSEFLKLPKDPNSKTARLVRLLWTGRTLSNGLAGNGAYIAIGKVKLANEAGVAEDKVTYAITRRFGFMR